ncbi:MAG: 4'-phosphopantetheinyl transferase superfamily protein [Beijerinckiaceae bacterium]|nr:4'-phosphopantetheinyl transferase superfamily protein [Beijerinckiaceae bacterium]
MGRQIAIDWLDGARGAGAAPVRGPFARVLVCDLREPAVAPLLEVAPDAGDLAHVTYPGASERSFFLQRRAALRSLVARCAGVEPDSIAITYDAEGAPRVSGANLFVSASSRGARAALAVASAPVGVDLEPLDEKAPVIEDVLCKSERAALARMKGAEQARAFLRMWTAKEAYLKALGRGFKRNPALICVSASAAAFTIEDTGFRAELAAGGYAPAAGGDLIVACALLPP